MAIEVVLPDSGRIEVTDTLRPRARALNGRGDSVAATITWASLDTLLAVDSLTGVSVALTVGTARLQARAGTLRSNPENVFILPPVDTAYAAGPTHVFVGPAPDSLSDSLLIRVGAAALGTNPLAGRRVVYAVDSIYPAGGTTLTFVPRDTVKTGTDGRAAARLQLVAGTRPDSVVVRATLRRLDGSDVPGTPVRFLVEFQP